MTKAPCFKCKNRFIGCHEECGAYKIWRNNYDDAMKKQRDYVDGYTYQYEKTTQIYNALVMKKKRFSQ